MDIHSQDQQRRKVIHSETQYQSTIQYSSSSSKVVQTHFQQKETYMTGQEMEMAYANTAMKAKKLSITFSTTANTRCNSTLTGTTS